MVEARDILFSGLLQKDMTRADEGLYQLQPLLKCSVSNCHLPCAGVCSHELYNVTLPFQLTGEERTLEIARQSSVEARGQPAESGIPRNDDPLSDRK